MKTDIEISEAYQAVPILEIAKKIGVASYFEPYGKWKGKIDLSIFDHLKEKQDGHLILVTSTSPTPMGEGKTKKHAEMNAAERALEFLKNK